LLAEQAAMSKPNVAMDAVGFKAATSIRIRHAASPRPTFFSSGASCSRLGSKRINNLQKRELMKIGIAGTDLPNAMLAHENCRMCIMQQITGEMR